MHRPWKIHAVLAQTFCRTVFRGPLSSENDSSCFWLCRAFVVSTSYIFKISSWGFLPPFLLKGPRTLWNQTFCCYHLALFLLSVNFFIFLFLFLYLDQEFFVKRCLIVLASMYMLNYETALFNDQRSCLFGFAVSKHVV
jgi:hypothetical protein